MMDEAKRLQINALKKEVKRKEKEAKTGDQRSMPRTLKRRNKASRSDSDEEWELPSDDDELRAAELKMLGLYADLDAVSNNSKRNKREKKGTCFFDKLGTTGC